MREAQERLAWATGVGIRIPKNVEISAMFRITDCHNQSADWFRNDTDGTLSTV